MGNDQQLYVANSKDIWHRDMCNNLAAGRVKDLVIQEVSTGKILAYQVFE